MSIRIYYDDNCDEKDLDALEFAIEFMRSNIYNTDVALVSGTNIRDTERCIESLKAISRESMIKRRA